MAIPRGFVAAADVVAIILFVGGAWVVVDRLGTLPAMIAALVDAFAGRGIWIIPIVSVFFGVMGALENMQEEIIPLVPPLLVLGAGVGFDGVAVVAMSAGAAMVGSAFGPTNPFQAGIALKLAQVPSLAGGGLRLAMLVVGLFVWTWWTMRYAARNRSVRLEPDATSRPAATAIGDADVRGVRLQPDGKPHALIFALMLFPMAVYVYGALRLDWGLNELSAAFLVGGVAAGLVGGLGIGGTTIVFLEGMQALIPAAMMVGVSRSISLVLQDGRIIDTILHDLLTALGRTPPLAAAVLMIPIQAIIHVAVPSVSGQAVLTMPLFVPAADVLGLSRQVPVLAYQTGAGLMEFMTPTNGALMAILLAAGVPLGRWVRFAAGGLVLLVAIGIASLFIAR